MAMQERDTKTPRQASFRHLASGTIVNTGCFHDITRLGGDDVDLDAWEAGFTDCAGRFYTREEAAHAIGLCGRLESESYFAGEVNPTLEAGHLEAWHRIPSPLRCSRRGTRARVCPQARQLHKLLAPVSTDFSSP